ncbi:hypothetical protein [Alteromonas stellipolaris]|uniref:Uncharacterized protein n=1 Tax=Alteromonas stellipolaris TaxID=233316 RepID=A0ABM5YHX7_9ALTE|nr:hypothetical protein [Alteromonas stellipolaris]ALM90607.1 hypothetical protein AOR13_1566 [Alteromonas stellipolaris LMG 21856]AMJ73670.1 hypothetical protein AVL57_06570 [Alteromonas stellipolaris]
MNIESKETIDDFRFFIKDIDDELLEKDLHFVESAIEFFNDADILIQIMNHSACVETVDDIKSLINEYNVFHSAKDNSDKYVIKIELSKKNAKCLKIFDMHSFKENLPEDIFLQISMLNNILGSSGQVITPTVSVSLSDVKQNYNLQSHLPDAIKNNDFLPEHSNYLSDKFEGVTSDFFKVLTAKYCLLSISSSFSLEKSRASYIFEGYARVELSTTDDTEYSKCHKDVFDIYNLIFIDNNFSTRLGLLRNIISVKTSDRLSDVFDSDLIKVLHSNYQIYLRENIKQYIEVKNKTVELMNDLLNKASDRFEEQQKNYQKVAAGLATYVFTIVLGKIVFKMSSQLFTAEAATLGSLFIGFSFVYLQFSHNALNKSKLNLLENLDILKKRYRNILHESELNEVFDSKVIEKRFDESNSFLSHSVYCIILLSVCAIIWGVYIVSKMM